MVQLLLKSSTTEFEIGYNAAKTHLVCMKKSSGSREGNALWFAECDINRKYDLTTECIIVDDSSNES
jgi:hypothetical protein